MKSKDYWKNRAEQVASKQFKETDNYILGLRLEYEEVLTRIRKDIESFYARFSQNNAVTLDEARRQLNSRELEEFKMSLKEFTYKAKHNIDGKWEKELNNVSYKVRISRLQALQLQIRNQIEQLHQSQQQGIRRVLNSIYSDTYYRNIYEIQKGLGISVNFAKLDIKTIDKIVNEPWNGDNYSSRIWNNKEKLVMELQTNLTQAFIRGDKIDRTSKIIADRMGVARNRATTLVNTESAYITSKATFDSYSGSGVVKQYEVLATLDLRTSEICRSMDGRVFNVSEKQIGVNAPPFHPNCRTTTVAYFEDMDTWLDERIARNPDTGKNYHVWADTTYDKWYQKYVEFKEDIPKYEEKVQGWIDDYEKSKFGDKTIASKDSNGDIINNKATNKSKRDGAVRAQKFSEYWGEASLKEIINKFLPNATASAVTEKGKIIYKSTDSKLQIVYDTKGNYFRIEDSSRTDKKRYLDIEGNDVTNIIENGKKRGTTKGEYQSRTHFKNIDKEG